MNTLATVVAIFEVSWSNLVPSSLALRYEFCRQKKKKKYYPSLTDLFDSAQFGDIKDVYLRRYVKQYSHPIILVLTP